MKKITLSVLVASSLLISACDQSQETSQAVPEEKKAIVEETMTSPTQVEETVTEVIEDAENTEMPAVTSDNSDEVEEEAIAIVTEEGASTDDMMDQAKKIIEQNPELMDKAEEMLNSEMGELSAEDVTAKVKEMVNANSPELSTDAAMESADQLSTDEIMEKAKAQLAESTDLPTETAIESVDDMSATDMMDKAPEVPAEPAMPDTGEDKLKDAASDLMNF